MVQVAQDQKRRELHYGGHAFYVAASYSDQHKKRMGKPVTLLLVGSRCEADLPGCGVRACSHAVLGSALSQHVDCFSDASLPSLGCLGLFD